MSDEFGPFRVGEVVILTVAVGVLDRVPGDEVTIDSEFGAFGDCHNDWRGMDEPFAVAGWLLREQARWLPQTRVIVKHGEVKRKPRPALDLSFLELEGVEA